MQPVLYACSSQCVVKWRLTQVPALQVRKVLWELLKLWPTPQAAAAADVKQLERLIYPLGLATKRAPMVIRFSREYLETEVHPQGPV